MSISVANSAMLLRLKIGGKTFETTDKTLSNELTSNHEAAADSGKVVKRLLGGKCKLLDEVRKVAANTRMGIFNRTLPYHMGGVYIVSVDSWEETMAYVKKQKELYEKALEAFIAALPDLIREAEAKLGKLKNGNELYPSAEALRQAFAFQYHLEPMPDQNLFDKVFGLNEQEDMLKKEMNEQFNSTMEDAVKTLRSWLVERLHLLETRLGNSEQKMARYKQIFKKCIDVADRVVSLNITKDSHINDWASRLKSIVNHDPEVVRKDPALRNTILNDVNKMLLEIEGPPVAVSISTPEEPAQEESENAVDYDAALKELIS